MPYIKEEDRKKLSAINLSYFVKLIDSPGDFNYLITTMCKAYVEEWGECYKVYNEIIGVLECAKLELYRRKIAIYEDKKMKENGDVY